jgi:uncharacterized RDD family membrane protein YckC
MTQPPDERPRPQDPEADVTPEGDDRRGVEPPTDVTPENAPTVAYTPPEPDPERPAEEGGVGYAAIPDPSERGTAQPPSQAPVEPATPTEPVRPAEPAPPSGPIISATPSQPTQSGWATPGSTPPPAAVPPVAPGGGWQVPTAAVAAPQQEGYVIAGVGARFVAWLLDTLIAGILPGALTLFVIDWQPLIDSIVEQARRQAQGDFSTVTPFAIPTSTEYILATVIGVAFYFLYFVFFWTSRWRATPGMALLGLRVVHEVAGDPLSVGQATRRWIAMGWPLTLLNAVPVLAGLTGLAQFVVNVLLLLTTATNERRQGLHDKFANSLVIRKATSGAGSTFLGCLLWIVLAIVIGFIISTVFLAAMWPQLEDLYRELPQNPV